MRRLLPLVIFTWMIIGCALGTTPPTATPTTEPTQAPVFIDARTITSTTAATSRPAATATTAPTAVLRPNCVVRTDWFLYAVAPGETLGRIAARAGTTAAVLASANCLANPDVIYAGQLLRVPVVLPAPVPATTVAPGNQMSGAVLPSPFVSVTNGQYALTPDSNVALVWQSPPPTTFTRVDFFLAPTGTGVTPSLIGSDTFMADGVAINYFVPRGVMGYVSAIAYYGSGIVGRTVQDTFIYALANVPPVQRISPTALTISPAINLNNNTYVVQTGQAVTIAWNAVFPTQAAQVDFFLIPPTGANGILLGTDTNLGDGSAAITWIVPEGAQGTLRAVAAFPTGTEPQASSEYYIVTEAVQ